MLTLAAGEVHIWTTRLPSTNTSHLYSDLSGAERDRVYRLRFPRDRWAYVFAHAVLRDVLTDLEARRLHRCRRRRNVCRSSNFLRVVLRRRNVTGLVRA